MATENAAMVAATPTLPSAAELKVYEPSEASVALLDKSTFDQMYRVAIAMARSSLCPKHLRGSNPDEAAANCLRVVNQAYRWAFDPFAVADESYVVSGKLGYQGKLVAAVVNARANLKGRLDYEFTGSGVDRTIKVIGTFVGCDTPKTIELSVRQAKTDNKMWSNDPDQKLVYSGVTKWARRWCPEVIMGVQTIEDLELMVANGDLQAPRVGTKVGRSELEDQLANNALANAADAEGEAPEGEAVDALPKEPEDTGPTAEEMEASDRNERPGAQKSMLGDEGENYYESGE